MLEARSDLFVPVDLNRWELRGMSTTTPDQDIIAAIPSATH